MTLFEPAVALSILTGAVGGGMAGARAGFLAGIGGASAGAVIGGLATVLLVGAMGMLAFAIGGAAEKPTPEPRGRLSELGFFLFVSPVVFAPVWVPFVTYRVVALVVGL